MFAPHAVFFACCKFLNVLQQYGMLGCFLASTHDLDLENNIDVTSKTFTTLCRMMHACNLLRARCMNCDHQAEEWLEVLSTIVIDYP